MDSLINGMILLYAIERHKAASKLPWEQERGSRGYQHTTVSPAERWDNDFTFVHRTDKLFLYTVFILINDLSYSRKCLC